MRTPALAALLALLALAAAGCISVGGGDKPVDRRAYDLLAPLQPPGSPPIADGPEVLLVEPFSVDPGLDREEIVWRRGATESGAYENFRWMRPPEMGVRSVLAEALRRSGAVASVVTDPDTAAADVRLRGHLSRCDEVDSGTGWSGVLEVRVALVHAKSGEEILRRTYSRQVPAAQKNPTGVVEAIRKALDEIAAALVTDVRTVLEARRQEVGDGEVGKAPPEEPRLRRLGHRFSDGPSAPTPVHGKVLAADPKTDIYLISVGAKDGLKTADKLTVFRGDKVIANVVVDRVMEDRASVLLDRIAGQPAKVTGMEIQQGDEVATVH